MPAVAEAAPESTPGPRAGVRRSGAPALASLALAGLICLAAFVASPSTAAGIWWPGMPVVAVAGVAAAAWLAGLVPAPRLGSAGLACLGLLAALTVWAGASIVWSLAPDRSLAFFDRSAVYLAAVAVGLALGVLARSSLRPLLLALAAALAVVVLWALATKVVPALDPELGIAGATARLKQPVGYANALAMLAVLALLAGVAMASERRPGPQRPAGTLLLFLGLVVVPLTYSRAGIAIAFLAMVVWLWRGGRSFDGLAALAIAGIPAAAVAAVAFSLRGVVGEGASRAARNHDGGLLGLALALAALAVLAGSLALYPRADALERERGRRIVRWTGVATAVLLLAAVAISMARAGGPRAFASSQWKKITETGQFTQGASRLGQLSSDYRLSWWGEALNGFRDHPLLGSGGSTFVLTHERYRGDSSQTVEPHDLPLQLASELGIVGLALGLGLAAAAAVAIRRRLRDLAPGERAVGLALALVPAAFAVHSLVDFPWEQPALAIVVALVLGILLAGGSARGPRRTLPALAAAVFALAGIYALAAPWLAERRLDRWSTQVGSAPMAAADAARSAAGIDPTSVAAVQDWAQAESALGNDLEAHDLYLKATRMQPENGDAWLALGQFQYRVLRNPCTAWDSFNRAYGLDPYGPLGVKGSLLDVTLAIRDSASHPCG
ncbi:MAG: O-antigen ligase family protein [Gaiellaceae bacterium]